MHRTGTAGSDLFVYEQLIEDFSRTCLTKDDLQRSLSRKTLGPYTSSKDLHVLLSASSLSLTGTQPRYVTRLEVFDFDSTLFRSPLPNPDLWTNPLRGRLISDCAWFSEARTLHPPYIPPVPGPQWWHAETTSKVFAALERPDTVTRIQDMCRSMSPRPLSFDLFFFREGHDLTAERHHSTTLDFKLAVLDRLLDAFSTIKHVELYDDRERHLKLFQTHLDELVGQDRIQTYDTHHVVHEKTMEQFMDPALERELVTELVQRVNDRITKAQDQTATPCESPKEPETRASVVSTNDATLSASPDKESLETTAAPKIPAPAPGPTAPSRSDSSDDHHVSRRVSISLFRHKLELFDTVRYTCVLLDDASHQLLLDTFPTPARWRPLAHHMTISLGQAPDELLAPMGGLGATVTMVATHVGEISDTVRAVRVSPPAGSTTPLLSTNAVLHVTLGISPSGTARQSNDIGEWSPLASPLTLRGTVAVVMITDVKLAGRGASRASVVAKDVSIGDLVRKHHPHLAGKEIGAAVRVVDDWMSKTFMENLAENRANIEYFIQSAKFGVDAGSGGAEGSGA
ncbi:hypothetical protein BC831DRAFT_500251 [Entophlyctis helioformis]|nr:hypothetical protein BC831DRAFT_500251 [Entophlyctis helioformis]